MGRLLRKFHTISTTVFKQTIKPFSPTPSHLKYYNLSLLDQFATIARVPIIFFYPNINGSITSSKLSDLKNSLSQTLSLYYPLSGRFTDGPYVDCDDTGVEFSEVKFKFGLSEILEKNEYNDLAPLCPTNFTDKNKHQGCSPLIFQLSSFGCGGVALTMCMSHKIADGAGMFTFLTDWANLARDKSSAKRERSLRFIGSSTDVPLSDDSVSVPDVNFEGNNCVTKKFVFPNSNLAQLKANITNTGSGSDPSRVQVLTALLYELAMAAEKANSGTFNPSVLIQPVNLRPNVIPKLPSDSFGNFCLGNLLMTTSENEANFNALAVALKKGEMQFKEMNVPDVNEWLYAMRTAMLEGMNQLYGKNSNLILYYCTSLSKYPIYEVDFGWGKPVKVSFGGGLPKNSMMLLDTPVLDGIEALLTLEKEDMDVLESDKKVLEFATS